MRSSSESVSFRLRLLARFCGLVVAGAALLVLYGWYADIAVFKSLLPQWIPMAPASALGFLLAGTALDRLTYIGAAPGHPDLGARRVAQLFAAIVAIIGLLRLGQYATLWNVQLDFLFFDVSQRNSGQPLPAPMALATATGLFVLGVAILLGAGKRYSIAVEVAPFIVAMIGWLGLGTYFYGGEPLLAVSGMAAHTAIAFLLLSVGLACARHDSRLVSLFLSDTRGGFIARWLIPPVIMIPVVFDVLRSAGVRWAWFSAGAGQSLFGLLTAAFFGVLVWLIANHLRRTELEHRALNQERDRLAEILESSEDAVIMKRLDGTVFYWNTGAQNIFGYSKEEMWGRSVYTIVPEDLTQQENEILAQIALGNSVEHHETARLHKDGTRVPVWTKIAPIKDLDGNVVGAYKIGRDLTSLKRAQAEGDVLREQYEHAQKMDSIGRLAGGIAHDFNNLLTVINGYSEMALGSLDERERIHADIKEVLSAGRRAAALTQQLLLFTSDQVSKREVINVNEVVADLDKMLRRLIGENIDVTLNLAPDLGNVLADSSQMTQVLMNLAVNARDAMPLGGRLTIETRNTALDESYAKHHLAVEPGPYVQLSVSDTGTGMDEATRHKIFEPFFTTKERGKGTGLGLSTVYGIVKACNGSIWVYSEVGRGTVFKIYLPRTTETPAATEATSEAVTHVGNETIVLIEDEEHVRELASRILRTAGYDLHVFGNGGDAIEFLNTYEGPLDLLVADVVMPGLNGMELANAIRAVRPGLKIVYMSGYTDDTVFRHGILDISPYFVSKPFSRVALLEIVRKALG